MFSKSLRSHKLAYFNTCRVRQQYQYKWAFDIACDGVSHHHERKPHQTCTQDTIIYETLLAHPKKSNYKVMQAWLCKHDDPPTRTHTHNHTPATRLSKTRDEHNVRQFAHITKPVTYTLCRNSHFLYFVRSNLHNAVLSKSLSTHCSETILRVSLYTQAVVTFG